LRKSDYWITGAVLMTQDARRRVLRGSLRVVDGVIAEIRRGAPARARVLDASGLTILPGFVQAHVHLCQTLFRNQADDLELLDWLAKRIWPMEAAHTPETLETSALLGIHELLSTGTTCVLDMATVRHTESVLRAVRASGIRANVGKCLMDNPRTTPRKLREPTAHALSEARALHAQWNGTAGGRIRVSYAPRFVISCTEKLLTEVGRLAHRQGALIHTHASENLKEIRMVRRLVGCENVEYLHQLGLTSKRLVLAHCVWLKPHEHGILKRTGTRVVHCPSSNLKLASGIADIPALRRKGIHVALGADGAPCNNNLNMFHEMRLAALLHKPAAGPRALPAQEVLDMATREGAQALDWFDQIGSIEVGKRADLIALDLRNPGCRVPAGQELTARRLAAAIVYSASPADLQWTMVDGTILMQRGRVRTIPRRALLERVARAQAAISRKLGKRL
jgi:5-methylthioadenosine/S-adenosylhomocysteine deaminase